MCHCITTVTLWWKSQFAFSRRRSDGSAVCCDECSGGEIELEENRLGRGDVGHSELLSIRQAQFCVRRIRDTNTCRLSWMSADTGHVGQIGNEWIGNDLSTVLITFQSLAEVWPGSFLDGFNRLESKCNHSLVHNKMEVIKHHEAFSKIFYTARTIWDFGSRCRCILADILSHTCNKDM